ncbi:MAG: universal stress protein [Chloroflexota bacterium]
MLNNVIVPLDGSALSEQALPYAANLVEATGRITLVSVLELLADYDYSLVDIPMTVVTAREIGQEEVDVMNQRMLQYLQGQADNLRRKGYRVDCVVEVGRPAEAINAVAERVSAQAIIMTTHGRTGFSKWLFGSVTQKVIAQMPCPVMVVPGKVVVEAEEPVGDTDSPTIPATS